MFMSPKAYSRDEQERILKTKSYLLNHLHCPLRLSDLTRHAAMGEQRFKDGFRLLLGYTPGDYLHQARMRTARALLRHTDRPIKEIAALCGYQHYKNFLTAYRRFFGETAGASRP
ncbi:MAG: AraC family transcriptional regulator [Sphingobacteriales bacterium]|nr:MAG: AraC family transcriptional regulator [Sphingobacteriales bacterium]